MALAGICWGVYSIFGRSAADPLQETAGNFLRAAPMALILSALAFSQFSVPLDGAVLAVISGAVTSGIGYALWYRALKGLTPVRAALVQLSVPAIAAAGGIVFHGRAADTALCACSVLILGGIALRHSRRPNGAWRIEFTVSENKSCQRHAMAQSASGSGAKGAIIIVRFPSKSNVRIKFAEPGDEAGLAEEIHRHFAVLALREADGTADAALERRITRLTPFQAFLQNADAMCRGGRLVNEPAQRTQIFQRRA